MAEKIYQRNKCYFESHPLYSKRVHVQIETAMAIWSDQKHVFNVYLFVSIMLCLLSRLTKPNFQESVTMQHRSYIFFSKKSIQSVLQKWETNNSTRLDNMHNQMNESDKKLNSRTWCVRMEACHLSKQYSHEENLSLLLWILIDTK